MSSRLKTIESYKKESNSFSSPVRTSSIYNQPAYRKAAGKAGKRGYSMAELPAALFLLFIGLMFPLLIMASLGYRASILYFACDASARKAAKSPTYTDGVTNADTTLKTSLKDFSGITTVAPVCTILVKPLTGGKATESKTKLAAGSIDTSKNLYFVRTYVDADLDALVHFDPTWMKMNIPGLTGPYHLQLNIESYSENPNGLSE